MSALRLAAITLTVPDPDESARFYRWCLDLKPGPGSEPGEELVLSWGREDRVVLVPAHRQPRAEEAVVVRMPSRPLSEIVTWCAENGIDPERVVVPPADLKNARAAWPDRVVESATAEATANCVRVRVRPPGGLPIELLFPLPKEVMVSRGQIGPFTWRSRDWSGLEIPGLLGVRTGTPDTAALRSFAEIVGAVPMGGGPDDPLAVGDHQWIVERRDSAGIHGFAVVVPAARIGILQRTIEHVGVDYRLDGNRLLAADPGGRIVQIQGVRGG